MTATSPMLVPGIRPTSEIKNTLTSAVNVLSAVARRPTGAVGPTVRAGASWMATKSRPSRAALAPVLACMKMMYLSGIMSGVPSPSLCYSVPALGPPTKSAALGEVVGLVVVVVGAVDGEAPGVEDAAVAQPAQGFGGSVGPAAVDVGVVLRKLLPCAK